MSDKNERIVFRVLLAVSLTSAVITALDMTAPHDIPGLSMIPLSISSASLLLSLGAIAVMIPGIIVNRKKAHTDGSINYTSPPSIAETNEVLHGILRASPSALAVLDRDAIVRLWNPAAEKLFGWKREEVIGRPLPIVADEETEEFKIMLREELQGKGRVQPELQRQRQDGTGVLVSIVSSPLRNDAGEIIGVVKFFESVGDNKSALNSLRKSEERLSLFMQHFPGIAFMQDSEGRYVYGNEAWFAQLPMKHSHIWRRFVEDDVWPPKKSWDSMEEERKVFREKKVLQTIETASLGDTDISMLVLKFPISDKNGIPILLGGVGINITEQIRFEEAARDYRERLSSLAVAMSLAEETERRRIASELHDRIGQALALCKIKLDSLNSQGDSEAGYGVLSEIGGLIEMSIQQIRSLTFQISPPLLYEVGLGAAVEWLGERFHYDYGLSVAVNNDKQPVSIPEEIRGTLFAIIRELLINVAKHADATKADVTIETSGDRIRIEVKDNGKGFDTAEIYGSERKGEGFGLFNIRQKISYLNGEFYIDSVVGEGTKVTVVTPAKC